MHPICPHTGKRIYKRHQEAAKVVGRLARFTKGLAQAPISIYKCQHGNHWHTTSMSQLRYEIIKIVRESENAA